MVPCPVEAKKWHHGQDSLLSGNLNQSEWPSELPAQLGLTAQLHRWAEPVAGIFVWVLLLSRNSVRQDLSTGCYKPPPFFFMFPSAVGPTDSPHDPWAMRPECLPGAYFALEKIWSGSLGEVLCWPRAGVVRLRRN